MSPEHVRGRQVDARSDIFSLGAVFYEMLAATPYAREDALDVATKLPRARPDLPAYLVQAVGRALAHDPAARFASAREFASALSPSPPRRTGRRSLPRLAALMTIAAISVGAAVWRQSRAQEIDQTLVAVLPFRIAGADHTLDTLRDRAVDLLQARLGAGGWEHLVETARVRAEWRAAAGRSSESELDDRAALRVAGRLGAGRVLVGSMVRTGNGILLSAHFQDSDKPGVLASATIEGPADRLLELVDQLAAELLARSAGENPDRLPDLKQRPLTALRSYLAGAAAYRTDVTTRPLPTTAAR